MYTGRGVCYKVGHKGHLPADCALETVRPTKKTQAHRARRKRAVAENSSDRLKSQPQSRTAHGHSHMQTTAAMATRESQANGCGTPWHTTVPQWLEQLLAAKIGEESDTVRAVAPRTRRLSWLSPHSAFTSQDPVLRRESVRSSSTATPGRRLRSPGTDSPHAKKAKVKSGKPLFDTSELEALQ